MFRNMMVVCILDNYIMFRTGVSLSSSFTC